MAKRKDNQEEPFKVRSRLECLYTYLDQLRRNQIQHELDIQFWTKRMLSEKLTGGELVKTERELNGWKEELKEIETKLRLTKSTIIEEKKKLKPEHLTEILSHVKPRSAEDMVRSVIDFFCASVIPFQIDYLFWQSRLLEATRQDVKNSIEFDTLTKVQEEIDLRTEGKANAEAYLQNLIEQREIEDNKKN